MDCLIITYFDQITNQETMSKDQYVCFQDSCTHFIDVGDKEDMEMHLKNTNKQHSYISLKKLHEKIKTVSQKITQSAVSLDRLRQEVNRKVEQVMKDISTIRDQLFLNLDRELVYLWFENSKISKNVEKALTFIQQLKKRKYFQFTCNEMSQFLKTTQRVKNEEFVKIQKAKIDQRANLLMSDFVDQMKNELKAFLDGLKIQDQNQVAKDRLISQNQPTITSIKLKDQSFISKQSTFSIVEMLQLSLKNSMVLDSTQDPVMTKKKWKKVNDNKSGVSNNKEASKSIVSQLDRIQSKANKQTIKQQEKPGQVEKEQSQDLQLSSFLGSEYFEQQSRHTRGEEDFSTQQNYINESDSQSETSEQDQNQLNKTILEFQKQILDNDQTYFSSQTPAVFTTIGNLQKYKQLDAYFNLRVAIIRVLYYSVLQSGIPKIKFIAGDHTGYGVFFTNYCPGLKADTQLEMKQCKFRHYLGSDQIINNNNFRMMREYQPKIKANLNGLKLNKVITEDLYYPLPDKRCTLVRQAAEIIKSGKNQNYFIKRMMVKVVTVIYNRSTYVYCIVGDSSGMMLAYLKKDRVKNIKDQIVVRLLNVRALKGKQKNGQFPYQDIMYLETLQNRSKVLEHSFDFLQIGDKMMGLQ